MPGYGKLTDGASEGYWCACKDSTHLTRKRQVGSLLAANFNALWCDALNIVHNGGRVDYFAMLHDDIGPGPGWLDTLIDELEANTLDVLGVAVPIKDARGLTSIALHDEGNNWRAAYRLTMFDLFELPETFTSEHVGRPLLLNTGCWVCKFDMSWADKVHFEINDRIVFNKSKNEYVVENESEDWFFSRLLHERGLKIGCTRKLQLAHRGECDFLNDRQWGCNQIDIDSASKSLVPNAFPYEIPGWLHPEEGKKLSELSRGKRVLEIGSYCGRSTVCIARTAKHVVTVDFFDGRSTPEAHDTLPIFRAAIERHGVKDKVTWLYPDDEMPEEKFDLAFIDGDHDYEAIKADLEKSLGVLADGGLLVFHDSKEPGPSQAIKELVAEGAKLLEVIQTLAVVKPPAAIPLEI